MIVETTDLERRVLAHERLFQVLITELSLSNPGFLARLVDTFAVGEERYSDGETASDTGSDADRFSRDVAFSLQGEPYAPFSDVRSIPISINGLGKPDSSRQSSPID